MLMPKSCAIHYFGRLCNDRDAICSRYRSRFMWCLFCSTLGSCFLVLVIICFIGADSQNPKVLNVANTPDHALVTTLPSQEDRNACFPQKLVRLPLNGNQIQLNGIDRYPDRQLLIREGHIVIYIGNAAGFCNQDGTISHLPRFDKVDNFSCGLAVVKKDGKFGYIDRTEKYVVEPKYDWAFSFYDDLGCVQEGKNWGLIDKTGQWIKKPTYKQLEPLRDGIMAITFDGHKGWIDSKGEFRTEEEKQRRTAKK